MTNSYACRRVHMTHSKKYKFATYFLKLATGPSFKTCSCIRYARMSIKSQTNMSALKKRSKKSLNVLFFLKGELRKSRKEDVARLTLSNLLNCPICLAVFSSLLFCLKREQFLTTLTREPVSRTIYHYGGVTLSEGNVELDMVLNFVRLSSN